MELNRLMFDRVVERHVHLVKDVDLWEYRAENLILGIEPLRFIEDYVADLAARHYREKDFQAKEVLASRTREYLHGICFMRCVMIDYQTLTDDVQS